METIMKIRIFRSCAFLFVIIYSTFAVFGVSIDRRLAEEVTTAPLTPTPVIITFERRPTTADFTMLRSLGITGGYLTEYLPMVLTKINLAQFNALKSKSGIKSLYANRIFRLMDLESRAISGVENLVRDPELIAIKNGLPVTGKISASLISTQE
jgi:hypothetical protein